MTSKHILAMRSDDGEISLFDDRDNFMASCKGGKWVADSIFEFKDLEENFYHISDEKEVLRLMAEARDILKKPLQKSVQSGD